MKEHELKTTAEILAVVNENNIDDFLLDFRKWLIYHQIIKQTIAKMPDLKVIIPDSFNWTDDGKHDETIHITIRTENENSKEN